MEKIRRKRLPKEESMRQSGPDNESEDSNTLPKGKDRKKGHLPDRNMSNKEARKQHRAAARGLQG